MPRVSTLTLAQQANARLPIPAPVIKTAPPRGTTMLVHLPTWYWLDPHHTHNHTRSATARIGDTWATATATPYQLTINPGDGSTPTTCTAPGIPYTKNATPQQTRHACTHTYTKTGTYTVTITLTWAADWTASDGNGGTLPTLQTTTTHTAHVTQARSQLIDQP